MQCARQLVQHLLLLSVKHHFLAVIFCICWQPTRLKYLQGVMEQERDALTVFIRFPTSIGFKSIILPSRRCCSLPRQQILHRLVGQISSCDEEKCFCRCMDSVHQMSPRGHRWRLDLTIHKCRKQEIGWKLQVPEFWARNRIVRS